MADWFVKSEKSDAVEDQIGPLKPNQLLELVRRGDVVPTTQIRKDDSAWFNAGSVGGLFEAAIRPTITYFCPKCTAPIQKPPTTCAKCLTNVERAREEIVENSIHNRSNDITAGAGRSVQNWLKKKVRNKGADE